jgi:hypothetical protein
MKLVEFERCPLLNAWGNILFPIHYMFDSQFELGAGSTLRQITGSAGSQGVECIFFGFMHGQHNYMNIRKLVRGGF